MMTHYVQLPEGFNFSFGVTFKRNVLTVPDI
jgi:hypothetical protein